MEVSGAGCPAARVDGITSGTGLTCNKRPKILGMFQPSLFDVVRNLIRFQGLFQDLLASREMTSHDRVPGMGQVQGPSPVFYIRAQEIGRKLVLHLFNALFVGLTKEKPDHAIGKNPIDECIDDLSEFKLAAELIEKTVHRLTLIVHPWRWLHHTKLQPRRLGHLAWIPWWIPYQIDFDVTHPGNSLDLLFNFRWHGLGGGAVW